MNMSSGEDVLVRPVLAGMCRYESIVGTELNLNDFMEMNEALDVKFENERRARKGSS